MACRSLGAIWRGAAPALLAAGLFLSARFAQADPVLNKADLFLSKQAAHARSGWTPVIVKLSRNLTLAQQAQLQALKADVYRHLPLINSVALRIPTRNLPRLAALPFVQRLSADLTVKKCDEFTVGHSGADAAFTQNYLTGCGVTVAVVDSGIRPSQDLNDNPNGSRIHAAVTFVPPPPGSASTTNDLCGHGTHVAGIIAGNGVASTGSQYYRTFFGIARRTSLINVRVLDDQGQGTVSQVVSGIQWCVKYQNKYKIKIINLSLGHPVGESYTTDPLCQAVESAWKAGITVVCAAGNQGRIQDKAVGYLDNEGYGTAYGSIQSPGNDPYVITVGAMKQDLSTVLAGSYTGQRSYDRIATYSSRGPSRLDLVMKPDLVAPGNRVISLCANNTYLDNSFGGSNDILWKSYSATTAGGNSAKYFRLSGTSMAAPVVSGAAALMLQANPNLSPDTIKARLMISADKWTQPDGTADPCTYGAGYLNIPAALACTAVPNQAAISPSMSIDANGNVYVNLDKALWGTDINGNRAVWGVNGVNDLRAVWGTKAIWGTSANLLDASKALWGLNVWSDRAVWGVSTGAADLTTTAINGE